MNASIVVIAMLAAQAGAARSHHTIQDQATDAAGDMRYFRVAAGDLNGDGRADQAILQVRCADGAVAEASLSPRDRGSGMATGKRQHGSIKIVKEWGAASPQLMAAKVGYDVKKVEGTGARAGYDAKKVEGTGARATGEDDWTPVTLTGAGPLCSLATINNSHSNIKN